MLSERSANTRFQQTSLGIKSYALAEAASGFGPQVRRKHVRPVGERMRGRTFTTLAPSIAVVLLFLTSVTVGGCTKPEDVMIMTKLKPVSPGELLSEEFLKPMGISQYRLAKEIGVPAQRIGAIVSGKRAITADTDLRLCKFFGLSDGYRLRAQAAYDTEVAQDELRDTLKHIKPWSGLGRQVGHTA